MDSTSAEEGKGIAPILQQATNLRTREEWLEAVLYSGRVTRIGQHLALVIYHLADTTTNIAKLSARDLERITGWSKTIIVQHLNELHELGEFLSVQWGRGRAKAIIELQGIIAEVMAAKKAERDVATTVATKPCGHEVATAVATTVATKSNGNEVATMVATEVAAAACGNDSGNEVATKSEKTAEGGTIGGESTSNKNPQQNLSLRAQAHEKNLSAPDWMISEDGGFEGKVFELSGVEVGGLMTTFPYLDFPADLVAVDQFLARQFDRTGHRPGTPDCKARMLTYLAKRNREAREVGLRYGMVDKPKKTPKPAEPEEGASCWFDREARIQVANGFRAELLATVGGDEIKLREALDEASGWVGAAVHGHQLMAKVRSQITRQTKTARTRGGPGIADRDRLEAALLEIAEAEQRKDGGRHVD